MTKEYLNKLCRVCNSNEKKMIYEAREMLCGTRERYNYFQCLDCNCLQIEEIPNDLNKFYPVEYYSFRVESRIKVFLRSKWAKYSYYKKKNNLIGALLYFIKGDYADISYFRILGIGKESRIIDVGCGMAHSLVCLGELGYTDLTGVDPYVQKSWSNGSVKVLNCNLDDVNGKYDVIVSNWSFEHMDDSEGVLSNFKRLLEKDGVLILRIPVVSSYAWQRFGVSWYNMDPPRHLYLHSYDSVNLILSKANLKIVNVFHESNWRSLFLSYCYEKNISPADTSLLIKIKFTIFKILKFKYFNNLSISVNNNKESDLVCFVIKSNS